MDGAELKALRKRAGLTQQELAHRSGFSRCIVVYWERKPSTIDFRHGAPKAFAEVLGVKTLSWSNARARGWGIRDHQQEREDAMFHKRYAEWKEREAIRAAKRRVICGAKTRKGTPCRNKSEAGRKRCKFHGGKSTGPKTKEGKKRIAEAQRLRWANYKSKLTKGK